MYYCLLLFIEHTLLVLKEIIMGTKTQVVSMTTSEITSLFTLSRQFAPSTYVLIKYKYLLDVETYKYKPQDVVGRGTTLPLTVSISCVASSCNLPGSC
jgi:hypothetical protein